MKASDIEQGKFFKFISDWPAGPIYLKIKNQQAVNVETGEIVYSDILETIEERVSPINVKFFN
jgi:hypothetical protein